MTDLFSRNLLVSCAGHLSVVLLIFLSAVIVPQERIDIRNAIRVDVVDLPKKIDALPELAAPAPEPAPAPQVLPKKEAEAPAKPETPVVPKEKKIDTKKSQKKAMDKLKAMEALEKIEQEVNKASKASTKPKADVVRGNQVAAGNSLTGLEKIEYDRYFDELSGKIHSQWNIPQWLADQDLKASVLVLIDERGFVIKKQIRKGSGNDIFDAKVIEAVDASSPLPPPPQKLRGLLSTSGIVFNFPQ